MTFRTWLTAAVLVLGISGCGDQPMRPDLARMYRAMSASSDTTPVIVIPGLFGSKLRNRATGREIWPGPWHDVLFGDYRQLALQFDPQTLAVLPDDLEAFDIAEQVLGQDFYGPIIDTLKRYAGYVKGVPGVPAPPGERRYYVFPYDWRQDNVVHAQALERLIDAIRQDYGKPDLRVDIVAHSMGGLIARYYLRYGPIDALDGSEQLVASSFYWGRRISVPSRRCMRICQANRSGSPASRRKFSRRCRAAISSSRTRW